MCLFSVLLRPGPFIQACVFSLFFVFLVFVVRMVRLYCFKGYHSTTRGVPLVPLKVTVYTFWFVYFFDFVSNTRIEDRGAIIS